MLRHVSLDSPTPKTPYLTPHNRILEHHANKRKRNVGRHLVFWALGQKIRITNSDFRILRGQITLETVVSKMLNRFAPKSDIFYVLAPNRPKIDPSFKKSTSGEVGRC